MISGIYSVEQGAYLTASLYLPQLDASVDLSFLVDSGASRTCIMPSDMLRFGPDQLQKLSVKASHGTFQGVGGPVSVQSVEAALIFIHDTGEISTFDLTVNLLSDASSYSLPSLLGREVLAKGTLTFDPGKSQVTFDAPVGGIVIPGN